MDWVGGFRKWLFLLTKWVGGVGQKKAKNVLTDGGSPFSLYLYWIYTITYVRERWFSDPLLGSSWIFTT